MGISLSIYNIYSWIREKTCKGSHYGEAMSRKPPAAEATEDDMGPSTSDNGFVDLKGTFTKEGMAGEAGFPPSLRSYSISLFRHFQNSNSKKDYVST